MERNDPRRREAHVRETGVSDCTIQTLGMRRTLMTSFSTVDFPTTPTTKAKNDKTARKERVDLRAVPLMVCWQGWYSFLLRTVGFITKPRTATVGGSKGITI